MQYSDIQGENIKMLRITALALCIAQTAANNFPCPTSGDHYIGFAVACGPECAQDKDTPRVEYLPQDPTPVPGTKAKTPRGVTSACFFSHQDSKAPVNVTITPDKPITIQDHELWDEIKGNITMPKVSCLYAVDTQHAISTVLPPGYACTLTNIPYCNPLYNIDFTFR